MRGVLVFLLSMMMMNGALSKDIAVCGASQGYGYYPKAGLLAITDNKDAGKWQTDAITEGRITLTLVEGQFDLLFGDATGAVKSATNDGGQVVVVGQNEEAIAVVVNYPGALVETYTFVKSKSGASEGEAIWSSNKYAMPILKVAAFRAPCSFVNLRSVQPTVSEHPRDSKKDKLLYDRLR